MLCDQALEVEFADLCSKCSAMAERISFLAENHPQKARYFLAEKYNQISERENRVFDRRQKKYNPPPGPHTPDRRVSIRRTKQVPNSPKRRKSDSMS
jgi:hypothetical protein